MSMSYLLASTDPETSTLLAKSLTAFLKDTADSFTGVVKAAALAVIFFFILKELINSFTLPKLLVAGLVGSIAFWLIMGNGIETISNMIQGQTTESMSTSQQYIPAGPAHTQI